MELFPGNRDRSTRLQVCHAASNLLVPGLLHGVTGSECLSQQMGNLFAHLDSLTSGMGTRKQLDELGCILLFWRAHFAVSGARSSLNNSPLMAERVFARLPRNKVIEYGYMFITVMEAKAIELRTKPLREAD